MPRLLISLLLSVLVFSAQAQPSDSPTKTRQTADKRADQAKQQVEKLDKALYTPFVERYVLDELKQLRIDMAAQKNELVQKMVDRELSSVDRGVTYATDTITYFFYLIAGVSSVLVLVGWTSVRDIKDKVHKLADEEITKLVRTYEHRLQQIESQLNQKTRHIEENREELERTQEVQALWLRAGQDASPSGKIAIYDQILKLREDDCEALTYKADAVLELGEPRWATSLCHQALKIDPENSHAYYQLACAYSAMNQQEEAVRYLVDALERNERYRDDIGQDPALAPLADYEPFQQLLPPQ